MSHRWSVSGRAPSEGELPEVSCGASVETHHRAASECSQDRVATALSFNSSRSTWTRRSTFERRMHLARFDLNLNRLDE